MADSIRPLQIVEDRVVLAAVAECRNLRVLHHLIEFVIDTGSKDSFLSEKDVVKLQVPVMGKPVKGQVDFGGSRFNQVELPEFTLHILDEAKKAIAVKTKLMAVKTTKTSEDKIQRALALPSILGMDFLKEQGFKLVVVAKEGLARLER